jgi:hypothetical protein
MESLNIVDGIVVASVAGFSGYCVVKTLIMMWED